MNRTLFARFRVFGDCLWGSLVLQGPLCWCWRVSRPAPHTKTQTAPASAAGAFGERTVTWFLFRFLESGVCGRFLAFFDEIELSGIVERHRREADCEIASGLRGPCSSASPPASRAPASSFRGAEPARWLARAGLQIGAARRGGGCFPEVSDSTHPVSWHAVFEIAFAGIPRIRGHPVEIRGFLPRFWWFYHHNPP